MDAARSWFDRFDLSGAGAVGKSIRDRGLPLARDEHWTHANLRALNEVRELAPVSASEAQSAARGTLALPGALTDVPRLVCVDGHLQLPLCSPAALQWLAAAAAPENLREPESADADLRYGQLASLYPNVPLVLQVTADSPSQQLEVVHCFSGAHGSVYPRLALRLAASTRFTLIERFQGGTAPDALLCTALEISLAESARLDYHRLHDLGASTLLLDQLQVDLAAGAHCELNQLSAGGATLRYSLSARLAGAGATLHWNGAGIQRGAEHYDSLVRLNLDAPGAVAEHRFRAIAADRAHVSCAADVIATPAARGAKIRQSLRGLIDGRGAQINLRPRLTINTDDIQASHGATTGQLDENLLFYLLARGIDPSTARSMLKWAFLGDVLRAIRDPQLRRAAEQLAAGHLNDATAMELVGSVQS